MFKKVSVFLIVLVLFSIVGDKITNVFAVDSLEVSKIVSKKESIKLSWEDRKADKFIIKDNNGDTIWEGKSDSYKIKRLTPNRMYKITLVSLRNGIVIDSANILTKTIKSDKELSPKNRKEQIQKSLIHAVVKDEYVKLLWEYLPNDKQEFVIKRNGEEIGSTSKGYFKDRDVNIDDFVKYDVIGYLKLSKQTLKKQKQIISEQPFKLSKQEKRKLSYDQFTLSLTINSKNIPTDTDNSVQASTEPGYALFYTTFIPQPFLKSPYRISPFHDIKYFDGDGRWEFRIFDWTEPYGNKLERNFRTRTIMKVKFPSNQLPEVDFDSYINPTHGRDEDFNLIATQVDQTANIYYKVNERTYDFVEFHVHHDSRNGLLPGTAPWNYSPYITYEYTAAIDKNGYLNMTGQHDLMPSHEVFLTTYPGHFASEVYTQHMWNPYMLFATNEFGPQGYINSSAY